MELTAVPGGQPLVDQHAGHGRFHIIDVAVIILIALLARTAICRWAQARAIGRHAFAALGLAGIRRHAALVDFDRGRRCAAPAAVTPVLAQRHGGWRHFHRFHGRHGRDDGHMHGRIASGTRLRAHSVFDRGLGRATCEQDAQHQAAARLDEAAGGKRYSNGRDLRQEVFPVGAVHSHRPENSCWNGDGFSGRPYPQAYDESLRLV